jgi:predicted dehydrogenase
MRVGIIGLGIMGRRMQAALAQRPEFETPLIWDLKERSVESVERLMDASDLVYIATPPSTHLHYARLANAARKPIFCEKPLAVDVADAENFMREVRVPHAINFPFASSPAVESLERRMPSPQRVDVRMHFPEWPRAWQRGASSWLAQRAEGGFVREVFSHFAYLTLRLIGPMRVRHARVVFAQTEISVQAELEAAGVPILFTGTVGGAAPDFNEWTVYGGERSLRMTDWGEHLFEETLEGWREFSPDRPPRPKLQDQLDSLVRFFKGQPHSLPDLAVGLEIQKVVEAILSAS